MFSGEINGVAYQLNGTVEEVVAQLQKRFPDLQLDNNATLVPLAARNKVILALLFSGVTHLTRDIGSTSSLSSYCGLGLV